MPQSYDSFISEARQLKSRIHKSQAKSSQLRLELMLLLVEMNRQELVWRTTHRTWKALLKTERLASENAYRQFEHGFRLLGLQGVEDYGVTATCTISSSPVAYRKKLIKNTRSWFDTRKSTPTHEEVARFVWRKRRELAPSEFISRGRLLKHIEALKAKLREHGIRPPRMK